MLIPMSTGLVQGGGAVLGQVDVTVGNFGTLFYGYDNPSFGSLSNSTLDVFFGYPVTVDRIDTSFGVNRAYFIFANNTIATDARNFLTANFTTFGGINFILIWDTANVSGSTVQLTDNGAAATWGAGDVGNTETLIFS